jgi:hypothetical protein
MQIKTAGWLSIERHFCLTFWLAFTSGRVSGKTSTIVLVIALMPGPSSQLRHFRHLLPLLVGEIELRAAGSWLRTQL